MKQFAPLILILLFSFFVLLSEKIGATAIVGIIDTDGTIYMGSDNAATIGDLIQISRKKIFSIEKNPAITVGSSGKVRKGQLVRFMDVPEQTPGQTDEGYIKTTFVRAVQEALKKGGALLTNEKGVLHQDGTLLVAYRKKLFFVGSDFGIIEAKKYYAIGSGASYCFGSLHTTTYFPSITPAQRVLFGLRAAASLSKSVSAPFYMFIIPPQGRRTEYTIER